MTSELVKEEVIPITVIELIDLVASNLEQVVSLQALTLTLKQHLEKSEAFLKDIERNQVTIRQTAEIWRNLNRKIESYFYELRNLQIATNAEFNSLDVRFLKIQGTLDDLKQQINALKKFQTTTEINIEDLEHEVYSLTKNLKKLEGEHDAYRSLGLEVRKHVAARANKTPISPFAGTTITSTSYLEHHRPASAAAVWKSRPDDSGEPCNSASNESNPHQG